MTEIEREGIVRRRSSFMKTKRRSSGEEQVTSGQLQIIDFDGHFAPDFEKTLELLNLSKCGFKFNVVTVLGCQSSGKSTLLNSLFGTNFPEMDAMKGRSQTTKGIWAAKDVHSKTLVIDVEGTDSKERGEDRLTFEHRASLFSLAVADAVIVNMWYQDLGRYSASNFGLLKTVLAVNLELFQQERDTEKTTMVFVIRDHSARVTPLSILEETLYKDLRAIWADIKKPNDLANSSASDFFHFVVVGLPSKYEDPRGYEQGVIELRKRWTTEIAPMEYSRHVPADGFAFYAKTIWMTILNSSELDIPSQKEMVASYRCEEIKQMTLSQILPTIRDAAAIDPTKLFDEKIAEEAVIASIEMYHKDAWRYQESVYSAKKAQLLDALFLEIQKPLERFLHNARQTLLKKATKELEKQCKKADFDDSKMANGQTCIEFWADLGTFLEKWKSNVMEEFDILAGNCSIDCLVKIETPPEPLEERVKRDFETDLIRITLEENLSEVVHKQTSRQEELFKQYLTERVGELRQDIEALYLKTDIDKTDFWKDVTNLCSTKGTIFHQEFGHVLQGMTRSVEKRLSGRDQLCLITATSLREIQIARLDWLPQLIHSRFKKFFEADENDVPYYWAGMSQDKISTVYTQAKKRADVLLPILVNFEIDFDMLLDDPRAITDAEKKKLRMPIMNEPKRLEIETIAARRMLKSCQEAQFVQATGGKVATPAWWWWGLLILLGWNEAMAILHSPVFMIIIVTAAALLGAAYYTKNLGLVAHSVRSLMSLSLGLMIPVLTAFQEQAVAPARVDTSGDGQD